MIKKATGRKSERGQSLIEFAFGMVVLLILLAGIFDLGRAFFFYIAIRDAAQEGAVFASICVADDKNQPDVQTRVRNAVTLTGMDPDQMTVGLAFSGSACAAVANSATVTVNYPYETRMPFFGGRTFSLGARVTTTILSPACP